MTSSGTSTTTRATTATSTPTTTPRPRRPDDTPPRHRAGLWIGGITVAWSTLAVGGVYLWASLPVLVLSLVLAAVVRPRIAWQRDTRALDATLLAAIAAAGTQVLPLPSQLRWLLSPRIDVDRFTLLLLPDAASTWRPLSLDPAATALAVALAAASSLTFWSCRHLSGRGHTLVLAHVVAAVGLVGATAAVVQRAVDPTRIYTLWLPMDAGARPFGPFVNRNHFATWLLMAIPLTVGALAAVGRRRAGTGLGATLAAGIRMFGSSRGWTVVALSAMLVALVLSVSRSAFVGSVVAIGVWCLLGHRRASRRGSLAAIAGALVLAGIVMWAAPAGPILARVRETLTLGAAERTAIWADARTVARTFPMTGTGLGTFERSMSIYQTTDRRTRTNQAHNQYLQLLAEGGALVAIPCGAACLAFLWVARRRLREDHSSMVWMRIGSLAGLAGVATQGVWETGLRMPANAVLLAVATAIAVHRPSRPADQPLR